MTRRPASSQVRAAAAPSAWALAVDRYGVLSATVLMVGALALAASRWHQSAVGQVVAGSLLVLLLVVFGWVTLRPSRDAR